MVGVGRGTDRSLQEVVQGIHDPRGEQRRMFHVDEILARLPLACLLQCLQLRGWVALVAQVHTQLQFADRLDLLSAKVVVDAEFADKLVAVGAEKTLGTWLGRFVAAPHAALRDAVILFSFLCCGFQHCQVFFANEDLQVGMHFRTFHRVCPMMVDRTRIGGTVLRSTGHNENLSWRQSLMLAPVAQGRSTASIPWCPSLLPVRSPEKPEPRHRVATPGGRQLRPSVTQRLDQQRPS